MIYRVGQKFKKYTPDMAIWCNKNGYYIERENSFYIIKDISTEVKLAVIKQQKKQELKQARNNYLKFKCYDFSENDKFNMVNLIGGYTEQDRKNYFDFLNNDLIPKYNYYATLIDSKDTIEEVQKIEIDFEEKNDSTISLDNQDNIS